MIKAITETLNDPICEHGLEISPCNVGRDAESTDLRCHLRGQIKVLTSMEFCTAVAPPSATLNFRVGKDWAVWGVALTKITFSSESTILQVFATFIAVKMLSPMWKRKKQDCRSIVACVITPWVMHMFLTSDHDAAKLCQPQDVDDLGTLWLH